jgi:hypothetical protein
MAGAKALFPSPDVLSREEMERIPAWSGPVKPSSESVMESPGVWLML